MAIIFFPKLKYFYKNVVQLYKSWASKQRSHLRPVPKMTKSSSTMLNINFFHLENKQFNIKASNKHNFHILFKLIILVQKNNQKYCT